MAIKESASFELMGWKDFNRALGRLDADMRGAGFKEAMEDAARVVEAAARNRAPKGETKVLSRSVRGEIDGVGKRWVVARVGPGEETEVHTGYDRRARRKVSQDYLSYGLFIEYGARNTRPRPWLVPALQRSKTMVHRTFQRKMESVIRKHNR